MQTPQSTIGKRNLLLSSFVDGWEPGICKSIDFPRDAQRDFIPEQEEKEICAVLSRQALQQRIHRD